MARKKSVQSLTDMSIQDLNSMDKKSLSKVVSQMASAANKRLKRLDDSGFETPASKSVDRSGGKFGTRGKTLNQLRSEFIRVRNFLRSKTSTIKGYKKFKNDFFDRVEAKTSIRLKMTDSELNRFWDIYSKCANLQPFVNGSPNLQKTVFDMFIKYKDEDNEDILERIQRSFDDWYEEQQEIENEFDTSSMFELS